MNRHIRVLLWLILLSVTTNALAFNSARDNYKSQIAQFYHLNSYKNFTLLDVKGYQQSTDYTCGPAAVMSLLSYYGKLTSDEMNSITELRIAKEMGTSSKEGTSQQQMVTWLEQHNFKVVYGSHGTLDTLRASLKKNIPVLVNWIDWGGHWVVVTGYNAVGENPGKDKDTMFFADPAVHFDNVGYINGLAVVNPDRFAYMWFNQQHQTGVYIIAEPK